MVKLQSLLNHCTMESIVAYQEGKAVQWQQLCQQINQWRTTLEQCPEQQIVLYDTDSLRFSAALLAIWQSGKQAIIPGDNLPGTLQLISHSCRVGIGEFPAEGPIQALQPALKPSNKPFLGLAENIAALTIFTSGSSGEPKPISKRLDQLQSEIEHLEQQWGALAQGCRIIASVSHQHIYGLLFKILWPLCADRPFINQQLSYPEELFEQLAVGKTVLISSPAHLKRLPETLPWHSLKQPPLLTFSSGGPLSQAESLRVAALLGCPISEVYGSSETGGIAHRQQLTESHNSPWQTLPGVEVQQSENGTLMVRSAHLENDQWYTTADRIALESSGVFQLAGRVDRIAKIEGKRIALERIEALLNQQPEVIEAKVVQLSEPREQLVAVVALGPEGLQLLAQGKRALSQQLRQRLAKHIERIAIPRKWRYVEHLPHNSQGKVTHATLLALFEKKL